MTNFEKALADYRAALEDAWVSATNPQDSTLYMLHESGLKLIERRYTRTHESAACRDLIEDEQFVHDFDYLRGEAVDRMRAAFERLVRLASS